MTLLSLKGLSVQRNDRPVVDNISFDVHQGECIGLIGPNGAGKTSLMRAALALLPHSGTSTLAAMSETERAKKCAWLPQERSIAWPMPVETVVALGRIPHIPRGRALSSQDRHAVNAALAQMDLSSFAQRSATDLSGGEQARVLIARALAQQTQLLMADEPIAGLDPAHQIATMQVFENLARAGHSVVVSLHDLGLAARHCTRLILLDQGRLIADGTPQDVLTAENLKTVFGVTAFFMQTEQGPVFQPLTVL